MDLPPLTPATTRLQATMDRDDVRTHEAARNFEATFLAEMLQYTGINTTPQGFGGGAGEDAFGSLLTEQYAHLLAERGGIGIAERIFDLLKQGNRDA